MTHENPSNDEIRELLRNARNIAVVGLSNQSDRPSNSVARYLRNAGYRIFPVNPMIDEWDGLPAYDSVRNVPGKVDIVDVFRRPEYVPPVVDDAIAAGAGAIWMQVGVVNAGAAQAAWDAGLVVIMDRCAMVEHRKLIAG
ncbi:MAG: CoA-binding protein [Dehalococcoidia bacterium]